MDLHDVVDLEALVSWGRELGTASLSEDIPEIEPPPRIPILRDINDKVFLWEGKLWNLRADAIVNTTNESMLDRTGVSGNIHQHAGPQLEEEIYSTDGCRTGESDVGSASAKKIIHTVGPRYNERYKTAAESALHYCYRNAMEMTVESGLSSIGLCCVYTQRKGYPRKDAAHIAIRTVRRFLEQFREGEEKEEGGKGTAVGTLSAVVFCVENSEDSQIYRHLLRLYFPRTAADLALQSQELPADIGNEKGEPVQEERQVRISAMPGRYDEEDEQQQQQQEAVNERGPQPTEARVVEQLAESESFQAFSSMSSAPDATRLAASRDSGGGYGWAAPAAQSNADQTYEKYLRRALAVDLSSVARHNFLYRSGVDHAGRAVFVLVGQNFPARDVDNDKALLHVINVMDSSVHLPYALVYVHSNFSVAANQPLPQLMQQVYEVLDRRYKKNIKQLYVLHPSISSRTLLLGLRAFLSTKFWSKVVPCETLSELYTHMRSEQVVLPDVVSEYEKEQQNSLMNFFYW